MGSSADVDLSKFVVNPSKSVTFTPCEKKQAVLIEMTNNCTLPVVVKFKNTQPVFLKTKPARSVVQPGEKMGFRCMFGGSPRGGRNLNPSKNDRFSIVLLALPKNANIKKIEEAAHKTATRKLKIQVLWAGFNDQKEGETQQPTNNDDDDDKDRQGQMRQKTKSEVKPVTGKKATVMMFTRKEGESLSDEDDDKEEGTGGAVPVGTPNDDMRTTRPAGAFNGQTNPNAFPATSPGDDMRTTRPAGAFNGQMNPNAAAGAGAPEGSDPKSDFKTTRPAGAFNGQVAANAAGKAEPKSDFKTTRPAGAFQGQTNPNAPPNGTPDMKTTKPAGAFDNQQQPNR